MKKIFLSLVMMCSLVMVSCGNSVVDQINQLVVEATELTEAAVSTDEVVKIATDLQEQMDIITAEAGNQLTFGADIDEALAK